MSGLNAVEAEQGVLGSLLYGDPRTLAEVQTRVGAADFTRAAHRQIWDVILVLSEEDVPLEPVGLTERIKRIYGKRAEADPVYISSLQDSTPGPSMGAHYANLVRAASVRRTIVEIGRTLQLEAAAPGSDPDEITAKARGLLESLELAAAPSTISIREAVARLRDRIDRVHQGVEAPAFQTGVLGIDGKTWIRRGEKYVIGARSGVGKSHLGLVVGRNVAKRGEYVLHVSTEMLAEDNAMRLAAQERYATTHAFREPQSAEEYQAVLRALAFTEALPFDLVEETDADKMLRIAYEAAAKRDLSLLTVDYYQDMHLPMSWGNTRDERLGTFARKLNKFARETRCTVQLIAALKDKVQPDKNGEMPVPTRGDIRETGVLSYTAPTILLLWERKDETIDLIFDKVRSDQSKRWTKLQPVFQYADYEAVTDNPTPYNERHETETQEF